MSLSTSSASIICMTFQTALSVAGTRTKALHQFVIAMSGSFDLTLDDGKSKKRFHLDCAYSGLYVCPMIWRELDNFSSGAVCMVLASNRYEESDYYRDYGEFMRARLGT